MTELEKEAFVNTLKQSIRVNYTKEVADEMCDRLDKIKLSADTFEQIYNLHQQQWQQFRKMIMSLSLP